MASDSSACAVYASLSEAQKTQGSGIAPVEGYDVYKVAREEELAAYRGLCRVLVMHHGAELPKGARRLLEDLREQLCVSDERGLAELEVAGHDPLIQGVQRSRILSRRADFFDGVDDITLETAIERARGDGSAVYAPAQKAARLETHGSNGGGGGAASSTGSRAVAGGPGRKRSNTNAQVLAAITKIGKEVEKAGSELLYTNDTQTRADLQQQLMKNKEALLQLQLEVVE